ncbi:MAG: ethanolamine ammonia-lyase reactivating factor EutA [Micropepsaceae bacterium]
MAEDENEAKVKGHSVADHAYGKDLIHEHSGDEDHDHDEFYDDVPLEENPLWIQDNVTLTSVGIDVGSSGTQVIFSRIKMRRLAEDLTSRYYVVSRETLYLSPVALTPYISDTRIDDVALTKIIEDAYDASGLIPKDIDTGAVILTGEALRRENAEAIAGLLARQGGDFVCTTAGHNMESMLAAYGSGASRVSQEQDKRILNIDMGGGTTKLALVDAGRVIATAAIHIGGRLQVVDDNYKIVRLDPAGKEHARRAGFDWNIGDTVDDAALDQVASVMAEALVSALGAGKIPEDVAELYLTDPLEDLSGIDGIMFSGGVAEYVYERESRDFSDLGRRLGAAIRERLNANAFPWPLLPAGECISATALGASEYSVQLSGNTSYISTPGTLLPRRNLQVLQPHFHFEDKINPKAFAKAIRTHRKTFEVEHHDAEIALAIQWSGAPSYERIHALACGIVDGLADKIAAKQPLYIMLDGDIAQTLGAVLREDCNVAVEILVIDGVLLTDFDYIDLGRLRVPSYTVPVTIKSLLFHDTLVDGTKHKNSQHGHGHKHGHGHSHSHGHKHSHDHGHNQ